MVEFIKNSDDYGLFILEGDIGGDDWITDHDHIKEFDQDLATSGTNFIFLPYSVRIKQSPEFIIDIIDFFMGEGADVSLGEGHFLFTVEGRYGGSSEQNRTDRMQNLLLLYANHLKYSTNPLYIGYRKKGEVWEPFMNATPAVKYHLKGKLIYADYQRSNIANFYNWKIVFRGVL